MKKLSAFLALVLAFIPTTTSAHHRDVDTTSLRFKGECAFDKGHVRVRGHIHVRGKEWEYSLLEARWSVKHADATLGGDIFGYSYRTDQRLQIDDTFVSPTAWYGLHSRFRSPWFPKEDGIFLGVTARWDLPTGPGYEPDIVHGVSIAAWNPETGCETAERWPRTRTSR
jgi:hypothetical protein